MTRSLRRVLAAVACSGVLLVQGPAVAVPASTAVSDPADDQTPGDLWDEFPGLRPAADLRKAVFSTSAGTLTLSFTFAEFPSHKRAFQVVSMSGRLRAKQLTFTAWRHAGEVYTSVSSGLGDETKQYCGGKVSVKVRAKQARIVVTLPVSCLPRGKVLKSPYPASYVTVLGKNGIAKGYVGSDSAAPAPDLPIRA